MPLRNRAYGTQVVAGVTPGKGGQDVDGRARVRHGRQAVQETGANASLIFVPARLRRRAILEAVQAGVELVVCITEGIPVQDMARVENYLRDKAVVLVGPELPRAHLSGEVERGHHPG